MNNLIEVIIEKVIDGDTMKVRLESGFMITIRLLLIDTPEYKYLKIDQQVYGYEASEYGKEKLKEGTKVFIEFEEDNLVRDKYDRYLCYLWFMEDGELKLYNEEVVRVGLGKMAYVLQRRKYYERILNAQKEAKKELKYIWSIEGYVINNGFDMNVIEGNSETVYIKTKTMNKVYHKFINAHNIKDVKAVTIFEAKSLRYKPCKHCYK